MSKGGRHKGAGLPNIKEGEALLTPSSPLVTSRSGRASASPSSSVLAFEMDSDTQSNNGYKSGRRTEEIELLVSSGAHHRDGSSSQNGSAPARSGAHGIHGPGDASKCGVYKTLGNIFISFIGAGILGLPNAFAHAGLILGICFMFCLSLLAFYCINMLVDCKRALEHKGVMTYAQVAEAALGRSGKAIVEVFLVLSQTGFCVAYIIFIYTSLPLVHVGRIALTVMILPFQVALALLRDLSALAPFSLLADGAHVMGMLVVLKDDIENLWTHEHTFVTSKGLAAMPFLFGVVIYCYEGIGMILPIEDSMRDKAKFKPILTLGFFTITAVFLVFGAVGYAAFGEVTQDVITHNLPEGWSKNLVNLALCCALFFTFPVMMVPVYEIIEKAADSSEWFQHSVSPLKRTVLFKVMRIAVVAVVGVVAVLIPNFGVFIAFIGSFCCTTLAFIIPASCHLIIFREKLPARKRAMDVFLIAFGFAGMVFGVAETVHSMATGESLHGRR